VDDFGLVLVNGLKERGICNCGGLKCLREWNGRNQLAPACLETIRKQNNRQKCTPFAAAMLISF
jgi:hypothetical protein